MSNNEQITKEKDLLGEFESEFNPLVEIGQRIGAENLNVVMEVLGGQKPHIPMQHNFYAGLEREQRDQTMRKQFEGNNYGQIAMEFGLSLRQTRIIVDKKPREYSRGNETMKPVKANEAVYDEIKKLADLHQVPMHKVLFHFHDFIFEHHQDAFLNMLNDEYGQQLQMIVDEAA